MREQSPTPLDHLMHPLSAYTLRGELNPAKHVPVDPSRPNRLLQAARKLLDHICTLQKDPTEQDWIQLQQDLQQDIKAFVLRAGQDDYPAEVVLMIRYLLSATLDETLLHHPQLAPETWQPYCLLDSLPKEQLNQEQFFLALERLCDNPARYVDALEVIYLCLSLGYEGAYRALPRGPAQLTLYRDKLYHLIKEQRGEVELMLAPQSSSPYKNRIISFAPTFKFWQASLITLSLLAALYAGFSYSYYTAEKNLSRALTAALTTSTANHANTGSTS